jgi:hypothetical protein
LLERGKIALAAGSYDQSIADLEEAERRFLQIEGTIPIIETFGSLLLDDTTAEYEPEIHEKLMITRTFCLPISLKVILMEREWREIVSSPKYTSI